MLREILEESRFPETWREEGRQEGQRELVRQSLEERFGTLEADVLAALATADAATLRAIVVHLAADTKAQVRQRLGLA